MTESNEFFCKIRRAADLLVGKIDERPISTMMTELPLGPSIDMGMKLTRGRPP